MARGTDQAQGIVVFSGEHRVDGGHAGAGRRQRHLKRRRAYDGVCVQVPSAFLREMTGAFNHANIMHLRDGVFRKRLVDPRVTPGRESRPLQPRFNRAQPVGVLRVPAGFVRQKERVPEEQRHNVPGTIRRFQAFCILSRPG